MNANTTPTPTAATTPTDAPTVTVAGLANESGFDPVTAVLTAAGYAITTDDDGVWWASYPVGLTIDDTAAGVVAEYVLDMRRAPDATPAADVADKITEDFIAGVRHVMNTALTVNGERWYVVETTADTDDPTVVYRVRFARLTDNAAAGEGLYPW